MTGSDLTDQARALELHLTTIASARPAPPRRAPIDSAPTEPRPIEPAQDAGQREELTRFDRLKTQLFATISHEFRTPLTLMLGPIEESLLDEEEQLGPIQRQRITMLQRNGLRLQKLVDTLLDFSRVGTGRMRAHYQPTDLAGLTAELADRFRAACESAGLTLTIETEALPEPVFVDLGEDRPQPDLQCLQIHLHRRDQSRDPRDRPQPGADGERYRHRHPGRRAAADLRPLPSGRRRRRPHA
jgi:signal transduction histidine kinase